MASHIRDPKRERFWRGVFKRYQAGKLTVRAFCQAEQLTESAFYFWRRTILVRDAAVKPSKSASIAGRPAEPAFLPVLVHGNRQSDGGISIEFAGTCVLRLSDTVSAERLAEIVHALEQTER